MTEVRIHTPVMLPVAHRVRGVRDEIAGVRTLVLEPCDPQASVAGEPGQFAMLYAFGIGEIPVSYSRTDVDGRLVHTIRDVGAVSRALVGVQSGDVIGARGPFGTSWPLEHARGRDVVIIAGGIGLAPLRPAILHLLAHRADYGHVAILVGARTPDTVLYLDELYDWSQRDGVEVYRTVDALRRGTDDVLTWTGEVGVVTELIGRIGFSLDNAVAMLCGPEVMFRFCVRDLRERGIGPRDIFVSMERNMKCAVGHCGHCQYGAKFVCKDGAVFSYDQVDKLFDIRQI